MSLKITKDSTATPDEYSDGDGSDPIRAALVLDGTSVPATVTAASAQPVFVWADNLNIDAAPEVGTYTNVVASIEGSEPGVTWELSLDGSTNWASSIALPDIEVALGFSAIRVYARVSVPNDGTVATANYTAARVAVDSVENPVV